MLKINQLTNDNADSAKFRVFCFHPAGGDSQLYTPWAHHLPSSVSLMAIDLPGRLGSSSKNHYVDIEKLIKDLFKKIIARLDLPYAIFGHSLGGGIAVLLAEYLILQGIKPPEFLSISCFAAPKYWKGLPELVKKSLTQADILPNSSLYYDLKLLGTLEGQTILPLACDIICLGAKEDLIVSVPFLLDWYKHTDKQFTLHILPGDHQYLRQQAKQVANIIQHHIECFLSKATQSFEHPLHTTMDLSTSFLKTKLDWPTVFGQTAFDYHVNFFNQFPGSCTGSLYLYDLSWILRIPNPTKPSEPFFANMMSFFIEQTRDYRKHCDHLTHPYCQFMVMLVCLNTIVQWFGDEATMQQEIQMTIAQCMKAHKAAMDLNESTYGHFFRFSQFYGRKLITESEVQLLLTIGRNYLNVAQKSFFLKLISTSLSIQYHSINNYNYQQVFSNELIKLIFGEFFPSSVMLSNQTKSLIHYAYAKMPSDASVNMAFLSHYATTTNDPFAYQTIQHFLKRSEDGLRPGTRMQEVHFSLMYMLKANIDVKTHFPAEVEYFQSSLRKNGVGLENGPAWPSDCDATAVAQFVANRLHILSPISTELLESFWNQQTYSYLAPDGSYTYCLSTALHVLEAYLSDPVFAEVHQLKIWDRTLSLLEQRPWMEIFHLSPFYNWEKVISLFSQHWEILGKPSTPIALQTLELLCDQQRADGGFCSIYVNQSNLEETALALLALKSALHSSYFQKAWTVIEEAKNKAELFLTQKIEETQFSLATQPDFWVAKLTAKPQNLVRSIVIASLYAI